MTSKIWLFVDILFAVINLVVCVDLVVSGESIFWIGYHTLLVAVFIFLSIYFAVDVYKDKD